jgi:hypothetical protein
MPSNFIVQLAEAIASGPDGMAPATLSIAGVDPRNPGGALLIPERAFQFWPDAIEDGIEIGWDFKDIPGASHSLAQWGSNGGRTISFTVQLHRFQKPVDDRTIFEKMDDPFGLTTPSQTLPADQRAHNVDLAAEVAYLRSYCYPVLGTDAAGLVVAYPPPIALICAPGLQLSEDGADWIYGVMTGCDVSYARLFANGVPRRASVALSFKQVVQGRKPGWGFTGQGTLDERYIRDMDTYAAGTGRKMNGLAKEGI